MRQSIEDDGISKCGVTDTAMPVILLNLRHAANQDDRKKIINLAVAMR